MNRHSKKSRTPALLIILLATMLCGIAEADEQSCIDSGEACAKSCNINALQTAAATRDFAGVQQSHLQCLNRCAQTRDSCVTQMRALERRQEEMRIRQRDEALLATLTAEREAYLLGTGARALEAPPRIDSPLALVNYAVSVESTDPQEALAIYKYLNTSGVDTQGRAKSRLDTLASDLTFIPCTLPRADSGILKEEALSLTQRKAIEEALSLTQRKAIEESLQRYQTRINTSRECLETILQQEEATLTPAQFELRRKNIQDAFTTAAKEFTRWSERAIELLRK
jgi:hypothetical protein